MEKRTPVFNKVACKANGFDLRPAIDALGSSIAMRLGQSSRPLAVLIGEHHDFSSHRLVPQGLMARLLRTASKTPCQAQTAFAFGQEISHNLLEECLADLNCQIPEHLRGLISAGDSDGSKLLRVYPWAYYDDYAPYSSYNLMAFCHDHGIDTRPLDAAMHSDAHDVYLDQSDSKTRDVVSRHAPSLLDTPIKMDDANGIWLRNRMMAEGAKAHVQQNSANLYIQRCGRDHLLGAERGDYPYTQSLTEAFKEAGFDVLPVWLAGRHGLGSLELDAQFRLARDGLVLEKLHPASFDDWDGTGYDHIKMISAKSGEDITIYPVLHQMPGAVMPSDIKADFPSWLREAERKASRSPALA